MSTLAERNDRALGWDLPAGVSASTFDGEPECPRCEGEGSVPCAECHGTPVPGFECYRCDGTGTEPCDRCEGSGVGPSAKQLREEYEADKERDED